MLNVSERKTKRVRQRQRHPIRFNNKQVLKAALVLTMEKPQWNRLRRESGK